jgi:hypothetical protein
MQNTLYVRAYRQKEGGGPLKKKADNPYHQSSAVKIGDTEEVYKHITLLSSTKHR